MYRKFYRSILLLVLVTAPTLCAKELQGLRVRNTPDHTRLVLDLSDPAGYRIFTLNNPARVVIDLAGMQAKTGLVMPQLTDTRIKAIRTGARNGNDLRVVLDMKRKVKPKGFTLKPIQNYGDRLVVDLYDGIASTPNSKSTAPPSLEKLRDIVIAVDAGHGGDDPGAVGYNSIQEKAVVLGVSKELVRLFGQTSGYKAVPMRSGDYYVGLRKRTKKARQSRADFFVSLHADAFKSPKARGASVYALSHSGASSETARWLAEKQNRADLIGGAGEGVSLDDKDEILRGVLLDLSMTHSMAASIDAGSDVLEQLGKLTHLHAKQVEQAGFVVLKSPDIPSLLIELGYISNPGEAKKLATKKHQKRLAKAIYTGITQYYKKAPPPGSLIAWLKSGDAVEHVIVRGDTLSTIAQRYQVSAGVLRSLNHLTGDVIRVGQKLKIPTS